LNAAIGDPIGAPIDPTGEAHEHPAQ
jgi:hypothetical protein